MKQPTPIFVILLISRVSAWPSEVHRQDGTGIARERAGTVTGVWPSDTSCRPQEVERGSSFLANGETNSSVSFVCRIHVFAEMSTIAAIALP